MKPKTHYSAADIARLTLKSVPHTVQGVSYQAKKGNWSSRKRRGRGGGKEYAFDSLPAEVQAEIKLKAEAKTAKKLTPRRDTVAPPRDTSRLNQKQRDIADARMVMVAYVLELQQGGKTRKQAISIVSKQSQTGELPTALQHYAGVAVAKQRKKAGFGVRALHTWVIEASRCDTPAQRLAALAPVGLGRPETDLNSKTWLPQFMAFYRNTNGINLTEAYAKFEQAWGAEHGNLDNCPSMHQVRHLLNKMPKHIREIGRKTGATMRALKTYVKRDWSGLSPNDVWVGDGHSMKMKVQHPDHGQPFTPELTLIMDAATRYIVGWSLAYSESTIAVADALRYAMSNHGIPAIYYSDNGSGQKNRTFDADLTGILPRLGIHHETGIPGNPQGRGIIERVNKTLALRIAREFDTYYGEGADPDTVRDALTGTKSLQKAIADGKTPEQYTPKQRKAQGKLPTWKQLLDVIAAGVEWYNNEHKHREIGNVTPASMRDWLLSQADEEPIRLTAVEAHDLFRPQFTRRVQRGWLSLHNNDYWHKDLENYDGKDVVIAVDIHDATGVIVRDLKGNWLCDARWNGNKRDAFPKALVEKSKEQRVAAAKARAGDKISQMESELRPALEAQSNDMIVMPKPAPVTEKQYDFLDIDTDKLRKTQ